MDSGYRSESYANSLSGFGVPLELPRCKGWILKRPISGTSEEDAMGCYPLFSCQDGSKLYDDLEELSRDVIALSLVTDPFDSYEEDFLKQCFVDVVKPFKRHFVVDLHRALDSYVNKHHIRNANRAFQSLHVERCDEPVRFLNEWMNLYAFLIERHNIRGIAAFSRESFARQLKVPGIVIFRAVHEATTVGMLTWYVHDDVGYYHLGAHSPLGYVLRDSFALFHFAIEYFSSSGLRWLNLGAGAGINSDDSDGLTRFKKGWSTGTKTAYFCGRIFDPKKYKEILQVKGTPPTNFFPAYRHGEF